MTVSGRVIFDAFGRTIQQFYPVTETVGQQSTFNTIFDTGAPPTKTTYDILDRVTSVTIPDNTTTTTAYDFGADRSGQARFRTAVTDARGVRKEMFRDVRSQITTVNEFNNGGAAVFHTSYAYDPVRQITGVTDDQGNTTSVAYDLFGRRTAINSPDAGNTTFTYDLADNLTAKQTANLRATAQQVTYAYQFNRLAAIAYPAFPANNVTYTYGAAAQRNPGAVGNVVGRHRRFHHHQRRQRQPGQDARHRHQRPKPVPLRRGEPSLLRQQGTADAKPVVQCAGLDRIHLRPCRRAQAQGCRKPHHLSQPVLHRLRRRGRQPVQAHLHRLGAHPDQEGAGRAGPAALVLSSRPPRLDLDGDGRVRFDPWIDRTLVPSVAKSAQQGLWAREGTCSQPQAASSL